MNFNFNVQHSDDESVDLADPVTGRLDLSALLDSLLADGLISDENHSVLGAVRADFRPDDKKGALQVIAECGWENQARPGSRLTLDTLLRWLSAKVDVPMGKVDPLDTDVAAVTSVMSLAYAKRFNIIAIEVSEATVVIGTCEPFDNRWQSELAGVLRKTVVPVLVNADDIERYLHEFYNVSKSVLGAKKEQSVAASSKIQNLEQLMDLGRRGQLEANDQHVVNIVDWLLQYAFEQRASDIHLEPGRDHSVVRFRIDGVLHRVYEVPATVMAAITSRIKILGRMDVAEKRRPQDGRLKTRNEHGNEIELRLSTMPTAFGEKMVMRVFDPDVLLKDATDLGFTEREKETWDQMLAAPNGIILVTGPTGSGKTTTLYTSLKQLATPDVNLCTVEDPIELIVPAFNQMQVQSNIDLDFATGVRTLLRQDPDIIMIGEIRDHETAQMAIQAALTGHLVISTLHTNDAPAAITRLLELGVPHYLLSNTIIGVLAQRLVRTLCPHCAASVAVDTEQWQSLSAPCQVEVPPVVKTNAGCESCRDTGYSGRIGIYELLEMTPELRKSIKGETDSAELRRAAIRNGMEPLRVSGVRKVAAGVTTIAEVLRVSPPEPG